MYFQKTTINNHIFFWNLIKGFSNTRRKNYYIILIQSKFSYNKFMFFRLKCESGLKKLKLPSFQSKIVQNV